MKRVCLFALLVLTSTLRAQDIDLKGEPKAPAPAPAGDLVSIEVKFMTAEAAAVAGASAVDVLDEKTLLAILPNLKQITAPRLTAYDKQDVVVTITNKHAYVRSRDKAGKAVNDTVQSGAVLKARPTIRGKTVQLAFTLTRSELVDPIAKLQTPRGDIELPLLMKDEITATLEVADGGTLALRVRSRGRTEVVVLLVRARIIPRPVKAKKPPAKVKKPQ